MKKIQYIEVLRIIACYLVIIWHVNAPNRSLVNAVALEDGLYTFCFYRVLVTCSVPLFVMTAGFLALKSDKEWQLKKTINKIIMYISVYIAWLFLYSFTDQIFLGEGFSFATMIHNILFVPKYHLWYLPMYIGLLIIGPILKAAFSTKEGKQLCELFLTVCILLKVVKTSFNLFQIPCIDLINSLFRVIDFNLIGDAWFFYFVLGYYLATYGLPSKIENILIICSPINLFVCWFLCVMKSVHVGYVIQDYANNLFVFMFMYIVGVFLLLKKLDAKQFDEKLSAKINSISCCTLGIYLLHPLIRDIMFEIFNLDMLPLAPVILVPLNSLIIFMICYIIVYFMKKQAFLTKFV